MYGYRSIVVDIVGGLYSGASFRHIVKSVVKASVALTERLIYNVERGFSLAIGRTVILGLPPWAALD